ncbi:MAG: VWA domain-containing protein [Proteobacteria bacterium]|nr:VWA domain-containing protein [Pseudomonadota bacterium]
MASRRRRRLEVFTMSFLDCICAGFGAVILLYMLVAAQNGAKQLRKSVDLTAEVNLLEEQVIDGYKNLAVLRNTLQKTDQEKAQAAGRADRVLADIARMQRELAEYQGLNIAKRDSIEKLRADVKSMDEGMRRLEGGTVDNGPRGEKLSSFRGTGERLYFNGLRVNGNRIVVLVDASASMLDETIVNVLRIRNLPVEQQLASPKWRRTIDTVRWITTQIPLDAKFQVIAFNIQGSFLGAGGSAQWLAGSDPNARNEALDRLRKLVPKDGTSLVNAFAASNKLDPKPDQVILLTDGLPTQGETPPAAHSVVRAKQRLSLFEASRKAVPAGAKVSIVLFPMEGDTSAPSAFWHFANATGGTFLVPSADWP